MITVVGSVNIDLVSSVPRLPAPGETVLASAYEVSAGGKGANQAVAAARAGSDVHLVARIGTDANGDALLRSLQSAGVHTDFVFRDPESHTGLAHIAVDPQAENVIVVVPGANALLTAADIDMAARSIRESSLVVLQLEIPLTTVVHAMAIAREAGVRILLNPAPARQLNAEVVRGADILVPNKGELAVLSGMGAPVDPLTAARLIVGTGCEAVVVTLGADGALVATRSRSVEIEAPAVDAIDTTGAGDAFIGNLAYGLDRGDEIEIAARFACFAAALSTTRRGAQKAMPSGAETHRFMEERQS